MKHKNVIITAVLVLLQLCGSLRAEPTTALEAEMVVKGWLKAGPQPLGAALGQEVIRVETFTNELDEPIYYIVYLEPSGFVIVSADDLVEPVIGFSDEGTYNPSPENPLGALVTNDLSGRIAAVRESIRLLAVTEEDTAVTNTQKKWNYFMGLAGVSKGEFGLMVEYSISDVRVALLIESRWGQWQVCDSNCYNYYTPNNYPCGCAATAMAQLMRHHKYPFEPNDDDLSQPDGKRRFPLIVDGEEQPEAVLLRGGDGNGGPYEWELMEHVPDCETTLEQLQAVGSICYDAGIATRMMYTEMGSGTYSPEITRALMEIFQYGNAIHTMSEDSNDVYNIEQERLEGMINANLDAGNPVILGIIESRKANEGGHAVICDGYGYHGSVLYHHLNMGWEFMPFVCRQVWYQLPDVSNECERPEGSYIYIFEYRYDAVIECIYNIFTVETGEIISGRVLDTHGRPIKDAVVTGESGGNGEPYTSTTNSEGIYALKGLDSNTMYNITVNKIGYDFEPNEAETGISISGNPVSGNIWGVNFQGYNNCQTIAIGTGTSDWDYPMHTDYDDSRTQVIYLASEIGRNGYINSLSLDVTKDLEQTMENWTIRMKHTSMSEYDPENFSLDANGWTVVYQHDQLIYNERWERFEFQTLFEYNGVDNLMVDFSYNNSSDTENGLCRVSRPGGKRCVYAYSNSRHGDPLDWPVTASPTMYCGSSVPNVKLAFCRESTAICQDIKLTASEPIYGENFGRAVSICGDYAVIGASGCEKDENYLHFVPGSVYIFKREGTSWTQQAKFGLFDQSDDHYEFGRSVSISGDYIVAGIPRDRKHAIDAGSADIYKREGTNWVQQTNLTAVDAKRYDLFGSSVSISGDFVIVGVPGADPIPTGYGRDRYGAAYIFKRDGIDWTQQAKLIPSDSANNREFGTLVSIDGDYAVVATKPQECGVYIFKREGTDWMEQIKLNGSIGDSFGSSISIRGDYVVVGGRGSVYIFKREGENWIQETELTSLEGSTDNTFGASVSINGDYVIVGAPYYDDDVNGRDSGSVYMFKRGDTSWTQQLKITAWDGVFQDYFGTSVSIDGNYIIIGAPGPESSIYHTGSVYILNRGCVSWPE